MEPLKSLQAFAAERAIISLSTAAAPAADLLSRSQKLGAQLNIAYPDARCFCVNDNIEMIWNFPAGSSKYLPEQALNAIANNSSADFSGDGNSQAIVAESVVAAE